MDVTQLQAALVRVFAEEQARLVFWNDPEREFLDSLRDIKLDDVEILNLDEIAALELKIRLEQEDPKRRYLLYSSGEEPEYQDDWLLDIRLYSRSFRADRASILLDELGLTRQLLRAHISKRRKFFDNKERVRKLKHLVGGDDNELDLDRKMLAVVARSDQPDLFNIVRTLFHSMTDLDELDLNVAPAAWEQIEKYELDEPFWELVHSDFGYREGSSTLRNLLIRLMVSDFTHKLTLEPPGSWQHLQLHRAGTANAVVCLAQWRDSSSKGNSFNALSAEVAAILHLPELLHELEAEVLLEVMTFFDVEKAVVRSLLRRISSTADVIDAESIRTIASHRQAGHWVASVSVPEAQRKARHAVYEALAVAAELFDLRNRHRDGFDFADASAMYRAYETELFRFDQLHRHFCWNADLAALQGWDMLKPLREDVEACYRNWYLRQLGLAWGKFVSTGLLHRWRIEGVPNQYKFFAYRVKQRLQKSERRRVFVIISDALRYEIAEELTRLLNGTYRVEAELTSQLGVLPSYTALGMASLLPHQTLEYSANGDVLLDGQRTSSFDHRHGILAAAGGVAVKAVDLLALKKEQGRELVGDRRVVYVYHDEIDARGDKAATEAGTFDAVRKATGDLVDLVRYVVNNLNGNYVLVTADHGFLFTETAPDETDKSQLTGKPPGTVRAKKRYLLGHDLPESAAAWRGRTAETARAEGGMEFWIPKGANRFHFTGGARFVHGGAMLQEIVVPVITVKHLKDKTSREKTKTRSVAVQVLGAKHKITAPKHRFMLIQMEPVSDRAKPITLKVAVYHGDEPVTSIETVAFESQSDSIAERQKSVILTLQDRQFDKKTPYRLVLRDSETGIEQQSVEVTIDRAITDDFDF